MKLEMSWAFGPASLNEKGNIVVSEIQGYYNPFDHYYPSGEQRSLYLTFADLDPDDTEGVLSWVSRYGVLGTTARDSEFNEAVLRQRERRALPHWKARSFIKGLEMGKHVGKGEPLSPSQEAHIKKAQSWADYDFSVLEDDLEEGIRCTLDDDQEYLVGHLGYRMMRPRAGDTEYDGDQHGLFKNEIRYFNRLLTLWQEIRNPNMDVDTAAILTTRLEAALYADEHFSLLLGLTRSAAIQRSERLMKEWPVEDLREHAASITTRFIRAQLAGSVSHELEFEGARFVAKWCPDTLVAAMYLMLEMDMSGSLPARRCENEKCGRFFVPSRPAKVYCSETCQNQERIRRWRQKKQGDAATTKED